VAASSSFFYSISIRNRFSKVACVPRAYPCFFTMLPG
jgi:hypothetical protein